MVKALQTSLLLTLLSAFVATSAGAAEGSKGKGEVANCSALLEGSKEVVKNFTSLTESYSLEQLPELAVKYPSIVMNSDQILYHVAKRYPARLVKDPAYRITRLKEYPIFADGVPEAKNMMIVGQQEPVGQFMDWLTARAQGDKSGKMFALQGPAGTGKTELLNILDTAKSSLAMSNEEYFQWTFEFIGLQDIPSLQPLLGDAKDGNEVPAVKALSGGRSPLVVLRDLPSLQNKIVELASPSVERAIGFKAVPFRDPSPQTEEVIQKIVQYYAQKDKLKNVTESDLFNILKKHVRIVRKTFNTNQPTQIIRAQGKNPDLSQLLVQNNLAMEQWYTPASALSYYYNGQILRADGGGLLMDEFFRQHVALRNIFLEIAQNSVVEYGGSPAIKLNVTPVLADNDESIRQAMEEGAATAQLDRTSRAPMRYAIEPWYVAKIAVHMRGSKQFEMLKYGDSIEDAQRLDVNTAFPNVSESGQLLGTDDRYALYYSPFGSEKTLIAPRALWMMSLVVAGSRIETDPAKYKNHIADFPTLAKFPQAFTDAKERLRILTGAVHVPPAVLADLAKARDILKEGQHGIGAREVDEWLMLSLQMAQDLKTAVTPVIIDRAFNKLLNQDRFKQKKDDRDKWQRLMAMVKAEFILPAVTTDVIRILTGNSDRVEKMYDEIKAELLQLSNEPDASYYTLDNGERAPIDKTRLDTIARIFNQLHNTDLEIGLMKNFAIDVKDQSKRYPPLMEAIRQYVMQNELSLSVFTEVHRYLKGEAVSESTREMGNHAEKNWAQFGYDKQSFQQALLFVRDQQAEIQNRLRNKPQ